MIFRRSLRHRAGRSDIQIGAGALARCSELAEFVAGGATFLLSSREILDLHGDRLASALRGDGRVAEIEIPDGESAKNLATAEAVWRRMLSEGGKRDSRLVAFGGGSVGDLGGFVAGAFLRGIAVAQVPTTLLAQVDASIGGKTAVDLPEGKNTVGLFHHPQLVVADTELLASLPTGELRSGLVEVVKMAALLNPALLDRVEESLGELLAGDAEALAEVVDGAVACKVAVVEADPEEGDRRRVLNYGHTLGHAVEAALGYEGLRHGEAVAYGILFAHRLAGRRGWGESLGERLQALFRRMDLPPLPALDAASLMPLLARDKKARESGLTWVLPVAEGEDRMVEVPHEEVLAELPEFLQNPWRSPRS